MQDSYSTAILEIEHEHNEMYHIFTCLDRSHYYTHNIKIKLKDGSSIQAYSSCKIMKTVEWTL